MANPHTPATSRQLPREFRERAKLYAPIIRVVGHADATLEAPLVVGSLRTPLPQFAPPSADGTQELELESANMEVVPVHDAADLSDADKTLERETRRRIPAAVPAPLEAPLPRFVEGASHPSDTSDSDVTLKRPAVTMHEVDDAAPTLRRAAVSLESARRVSLARLPTPFHAVTLEAAPEAELDLDDLELDEASPDSTRESIAITRRRRVQGNAVRVLAALAAVAVVILSVAAIRLGQDASRNERVMLETKLEIAQTRTAPRSLAAMLAPKPVPEKPREPVEIAVASTATAELLPVATAAPEAAKTTPVIATAKAPLVPTTKPKAPIMPTAKAKTPVMPTAKPKPKTAPTTLPKTKTKVALPPKSTTTTVPVQKSSFGTLHTPVEAKGHRVFVDGFIGGYAPIPFKLKCGKHSVRVGSAGKLQSIDIPCGGDAWAAAK